MTDNSNDPDSYSRAIEEASDEAVREAIRKQRLLGYPVVSWENGEIKISTDPSSQPEA